MQRIVEDKVEKEKSKTTKIIEELQESEYFKCGDLVDILDLDDSESAGACYEAEIAKITVKEGSDAVEDGLTYRNHLVKRYYTVQYVGLCPKLL